MSLSAKQLQMFVVFWLINALANIRTSKCEEAAGALIFFRPINKCTLRVEYYVGKLENFLKFNPNK